MSIFIKAGLWVERQLGYKGELNLTQLIQTSAPPPLPYKEFFFRTNGVGTAPTLILNNTFTNAVTFSTDPGNYTRISCAGAFPDANKVIMEVGDEIRLMDYNDANSVKYSSNYANNIFMSIKVYN